MSCSLNSLKGGYIRDYRDYRGIIGKLGFRAQGLGFRL